MPKRRAWLVLILEVVVFLGLSCATVGKEGKLDPVSEEFLSHARYIITAEETKIFRELPPSARPRFIDEFWERRDPTPETEVNEFRDTYFARIEEANRLFRGPRPGWLQDRGRAYVLFGPPNERQTNPMGGRPIDAYEDPRESLESRRVAAGEKPTEVWVYYNLFSSLQRPHAVKLVFVDIHGTGDYTLTTDLDEVVPGGVHALIAPDLNFMHEFYKEEAERSRLHLKRALFDFNWEFLKEKDREKKSRLSIRLTVPYRRLIFGGEQGRFAARLELDLEVRDEKGQAVWGKSLAYDLDFRQGFLEQNREESWEAVVEVDKPLPPGKFQVYISLRNSTGEQSVEKLLSLKM